MYPAHGSAAGSSASSARAGLPPRPSRPSPAGSSPTSSAARLRSRWPAWSGSSARSPTSACALARRRTPAVVLAARLVPRPARRARPQPRIALAQGFYGGGLIAAAPLYAIVNVDRLDLSLSDVGIIGILTAARHDLLLPALGRRVATGSGRWSRCGSGARSGSRRWSPTRSRPTSPSCGSRPSPRGRAARRSTSGSPRSSATTPRSRSRAAAMAGWNAITGARGIVAAFTMSTLLQIGIVDVTSGLLLCAAVSAIGVVLYARARRAIRSRMTAAPSRRRRVEPGSSTGCGAPPAAGGAWRVRGLHGAIAVATMALDAPDALGGGAAPRLHRRRARPTPPRAGPGAQRARGDRAHLRRDVRGGPGRRDLRRRRGRRRAPRSRPDEVMPGVRELVDEVRLEVLMGDGTRLWSCSSTRSGRPGSRRRAMGPGAVRPAPTSAGSDGADAPIARSIELTVRSESRRVIRVTLPLPVRSRQQPARLRSRRRRGFRLDLPAGASERWSPGETRTVRLVRFGGERGGRTSGRPLTRLSPAERLARYGPTTGDRVRLADTDLWVNVAEDRQAPGDEPIWGYAKTLRPRSAQGRPSPSELDVVVAGALVARPARSVPSRPTSGSRTAGSSASGGRATARSATASSCRSARTPSRSWATA